MCIYKWLIDIIDFMLKIVDVFMCIDFLVSVDVNIQQEIGQSNGMKGYFWY